MTGRLIVSVASFPYGACIVANYTRQAEIIFDNTTNGPILELNGSKISEGQAIVHALAAAGGLSGDSDKVCSGSSC